MGSRYSTLFGNNLVSSLKEDLNDLKNVCMADGKFTEAGINLYCEKLLSIQKIINETRAFIDGINRENKIIDKNIATINGVKGFHSKLIKEITNLRKKTNSSYMFYSFISVASYDALFVLSVYNDKYKVYGLEKYMACQIGKFSIGTLAITYIINKLVSYIQNRNYAYNTEFKSLLTEIKELEDIISKESDFMNKEDVKKTSLDNVDKVKQLENLQNVTHSTNNNRCDSNVCDNKKKINTDNFDNNNSNEYYSYNYDQEIYNGNRNNNN